jgi:hypothetical protein
MKLRALITAAQSIAGQAAYRSCSAPHGKLRRHRERRSTSNDCRILDALGTTVTLRARVGCAKSFSGCVDPSRAEPRR